VPGVNLPTRVETLVDASNLQGTAEVLGFKKDKIKLFLDLDRNTLLKTAEKCACEKG